jgi:inorganic pyrophosphatase
MARGVATSVAGDAGTESFRVFFDEAGKKISPWHDIPLKAGDLFNFVNEIPKYTKAKMEVSTKEASNPIAQDIKKGKLRDYHGPIFWNYGCLPQTWEDPDVLNPAVNCKGDNDPVDVVEIGSKALATGSVVQVKVLGALAMIDDGELDWKIIAISKDDPLFSQLNDIGDVEVKLPGVVSGIREWFRWYKTPDDKPLNAFGYAEKALDKKFALEVIEETHGYWKSLKAGSTPKGKLWIA